MASPSRSKIENGPANRRYCSSISKIYGIAGERENRLENASIFGENRPNTVWAKSKILNPNGFRFKKLASARFLAGVCLCRVPAWCLNKSQYRVEKKSQTGMKNDEAKHTFSRRKHHAMAYCTACLRCKWRRRAGSAGLNSPVILSEQIRARLHVFLCERPHSEGQKLRVREEAYGFPQTYPP